VTGASGLDPATLPTDPARATLGPAARRDPAPRGGREVPCSFNVFKPTRLRVVVFDGTDA
jgi:hypothetical protein